MPQTLSPVEVAGDHSRPRPFEPRLKIVSRVASHAETVRFLMDEIEMRYCIVPTAALSSKLFKAFQHLSLAEFDDWADRLSNLSAADPAWLGLVESLTAQQRYFNREPGLLLVVRRGILARLISGAEKDPSPAIRILSVGCTTGEEAYDLAFQLLEALREAGHATTDGEGAIVVDPRWRIEVIGSDVSRQAMEIGAAAVYSDHWLGSFQGMHQKMWHFFEGTPAPKEQWVPGARYWQVKHFARRHVRFQHCDLLAGVPPVTGCDLTICRDVLTYFDHEGKLKVQRMLAASLKPGSFLLQGDSDAQLLPELYLRESEAGLPYFRKR